MMKPKLAPIGTLCVLAVFATAWACLAAGKPAANSEPPTLTAMKDELGRSMETLSKGEPPVYFISYTVSDRQEASVSGSNGALLSSTEDRGRWLEVQTRVGDYQLDDTHKLANRQPS